MALIVMLLFATFDRGAPGGQNRTVFRQPKVPIETRLQPGDQHLTVLSGPWLPQMGRPDTSGPLADTFKGLTLLSNAVVIGVVETAEPALTQERDWITTRVTVRPETVLRNLTGRPLRGPLVYEREGGQMTIQAVKVDAVAEWDRPFVPGNRYLLFLYQSNDRLGPWWKYEVTPEGKLQSMDGLSYTRGLVDGGAAATLSEAVQVIKQHARTP